MAVSVFAAFTGACVCLSPLACFVGIDRTVTVRPGGEVTVKGTDGEDLPGASVTVYRLSYPHDMPGGDWTVTTNARGVASFVATEEEETVRPLMMHGVPEYYWQVCAEAEGYGASRQRWPREAEAAPRDLVVQLEPGTETCAGLLPLP